ncbi:growth hormone secretagogue receptor type 1-like [Pomacea canaliculata]|nr:growth hormone secretagogue receptor type 1-like [Pomacea canaliculata]
MTTYAAHVPQQTTISGNSSLPKTSTAIEELLLSESQRQLISQIVGTSFIPIIFLLGSAGNVITLAVLFRQGLRDTTNLVLSGLAFADLVYIASHSIPQISYFVYSLDEGLATAWRLGSTMALQHVSFASGRIAALLVCLIVTERYIVVAFPLHAPGIVTKLRMRLAFGFIYLATTVISLPFFLSSDIYYTYSTTYNRYMPTSWVTQFG